MLLSFWVGIFIILFLIIAGCSAPQQTSIQSNEITSIPTSIPTVTQATLVPAITSPTEISNISSNTTTQKVTITPTLQQPTNAGDNPLVLNFEVTKNYFQGNIANCPMQEIFPTFAKDPNYGLNKPVPKIAAISAGDYRTFIRDFTEGKNQNTKVIGVTRCEGAIIDPYWNFIELNAKVTARNARPANYTVTFNVRSQGKIVARFNTTELLTKDQIVSFVSYVPLRMDEMFLFDSAELTFTQLPN